MSKRDSIQRIKGRKKRFLCDPQSKFLWVWDLVMLFSLIFSISYNPFEAAFLTEFGQVPLWTTLNVFVELLFLLDMIAVFNTSYYQEDYTLQENRKKIAINYLRKSFIFDLIALIPFSYFLYAIGLDSNTVLYIVARLPKMIRITRLYSIYNYITDNTKPNSFNQNI